jgi:hypothetical protein
MTLTRTRFFLYLFLLLLVPFLTPKLLWLTNTRTTTGRLAFEGRGDAGEQMPLNYTIIWFRRGSDTIWIRGLGNLGLHPGDPVPIRYKADDPSNARVNIFAGIWGDTLVYGGIPLFMLLVIYLHPTVVPRRSKVRLVAGRPFIRLVQPAFRK